MPESVGKGRRAATREERKPERQVTVDQNLSVCPKPLNPPHKLPANSNERRAIHRLGQQLHRKCRIDPKYYYMIHKHGRPMNGKYEN